MTLNLSQKERTLLEDQKKHEIICIEKYSNYAGQANNEQLKQICKANEQSERSHLDSINQLLNGTVPQMNQQQSQNSQQNQNAQQMQGAQSGGMGVAQPGASSFCDKSICQDILMTEKYVSQTYDNAVFGFTDTNVRNVLNHIQKEEQQHGEAISKHMENTGMNSIQ